jgi:hypothetical protein
MTGTEFRVREDYMIKFQINEKHLPQIQTLQLLIGYEFLTHDESFFTWFQINDEV